MIRSLDTSMLPAFLTLAGKVSLLFAAGFALAASLRHRSASARHLVWLFTLSGALALVLIAPIAPRLSLGILPPPAHPEPITMAAGAVPMGVESVRPGPAPSEVRHRGPRDAGRPESLPRSAGARSAVLPTLGSLLPSPATMAALWLTGFLAVLLWCLLGHIGLARLARSSMRLSQASWHELVRNSLARAGSPREVRFGSSAGVGSPITWGWPRAVILLPEAAGSWPEDRRRVAVMHELAHVVRQDYLAQLLATLACAVFWFHPLVWIAAHRLRVESEHACDDLVLIEGTPAPEYATHLLEVARGERTLRLSGIVAVSMARRSHLEGRLLAVLDEQRTRHAVSLRARAAIAAAIACALIPFAGLRLTAGTASASAHRTSTHHTPPAASTPSRTPSSAPAPAGVPPTPEAAASSSGEGDGYANIQRTYPASPGERLELDLETGGEVRLIGSDQHSVVVRAHLAGNDWRDSRVAVERLSGGVRVRATFEGNRSHFSTSHSFDIQVPRRFDVHLNSAGGGLIIKGVEGEFRGQTGGGELVLDHVKGRAHLSTGGGDIQVTDSDLSGFISTGGGVARLSRVHGGLRAWSGSGPVVYSEDKDSPDPTAMGDLGDMKVDESHMHMGKVRRDTHGVLHVDKAGGEIDLDEAPAGARITTGGGDVHVGPAAGTVEAHTGGGDIEIGPVKGSVIAGTGAGTVHVTLADARGEEQTVEIKSGTGKVIVDLPASLDASFDLETAYTRSHGRATEINSAWPLDHETTQNWDDRQGTPRRYVRATGVAGNGRGRIHIRTVNGNIEVRRAGN